MFVGYVDRDGYGYTFDGKRIGRKLRDERGAPVMEIRERIVSVNRVNYGLLTKHSSFLAKPVMDRYEGDLYITNQRLIGVREPKAWEGVMKRGFALPTPAGISDAWRTRAVAKAGGKEYFELALNEIVKTKVFKSLTDKNVIYIYILSGEKKYHLSLYCKPEILGDLLQKR